MTHRAPTRRSFAFHAGLAVTLAVVLGGAVGFAISKHRGSQPDQATVAVQPIDTKVPADVADIPLTNQYGAPTDLAALRGRIVVFADFMTSCQEECPITTGALLTVERSIAEAHETDRVAVVEITVDPGRDSPSRLLAFENKFDAHLTTLTGTPANISRLWAFFGVWYKKVAESNPPDIDWQTGRPYTYDITHTDDAFVLGTSGSVRALSIGNADVDKNLSKPLSSLLDAEGRHDLTQPGLDSWTPADMLHEVGTLLGHPIPVSDPTTGS
jgi:cytochrome oxidase Cu insertion factor (SCO1/SenC/PrrC family)